jgi:thioredoxin reductase
MPSLDAIVVGAGPAGLSAALVLGRCRRQVLVIDRGNARNAPSGGLHGFLTRDGILPADLLSTARAQLASYRSVRLLEAVVEKAWREEGRGFVVELADGARHVARRLLLATGVMDDWPAIEGLAERVGRSVFHCVYCDGWEMRGQPLGACGCGPAAARLALELSNWSRDVIVFCEQADDVGDDEATMAARRLGLAFETRRVVRLEGPGRELERVVLEDGTAVARVGLFISTGKEQSSPLVEGFGVPLNAHGSARTDSGHRASVPGLYVAGDASRGLQLAIVAAGEGARAAYDINQSLLSEDLGITLT